MFGVGNDLKTENDHVKKMANAYTIDLQKSLGF